MGRRKTERTDFTNDACQDPGDDARAEHVRSGGGYGQTIHEMREMRALAMGQYGHNNQPSHHHVCGCWGCSAIEVTRTA